MKIIGFDFTKINVEKTGDFTPNLKISTNLDIIEITEAKSDSLKIKEDLVAVKFSYGLSYDPNFAKIGFEGNVLLALDSKIAKEVLKSWKDKKIYEGQFRVSLFNVILKKTNLRALQLEEAMNLPLHLPMPSIQEKSDKKE